MLLVLNGLLDFGGEEVTGLLFLDLVNITESTVTQFLNDLISLI